MLNLLRHTRPLPFFAFIHTQGGVNSRTPVYPRPKKAAQHHWVKKEESPILKQLLLLIKERNTDVLFETLLKSREISPELCAKVMMSKFGVSFPREIVIKERILEIMRTRKFKPTTNSIDSMILTYGKSNSSLHKADALLDMMYAEGIERYATTYNSLMKINKKNPVKINEIYRLLIEDWVSPDLSTYALMIKAFSEDLEKAESLYHLMMKAGIKPDIFIYNSMIDVYSKCGRLKKAKDMLKSMRRSEVKPNVMIYTSIIKAFSKDLGNVEAFYQMMIEDGVRPDVVIYNSMIDVYSKAGMAEKAVEMFASLKNDQIMANVKTYTTMINLYGKMGMVDQATGMYVLMKGDQLKPTAATFAALIDCYTKCLPSLGEKGADRVVELILQDEKMNGWKEYAEKLDGLVV
jgi:pentatricopeptide repeat protein